MNGEIRVDITAMNMSEENIGIVITPAVNASSAITISVSPFAFIAQPTVKASRRLWKLM